MKYQKQMMIIKQFCLDENISRYIFNITSIRCNIYEKHKNEINDNFNLNHNNIFKVLINDMTERKLKKEPVCFNNSLLDKYIYEEKKAAEAEVKAKAPAEAEVKAPAKKSIFSFRYKYFKYKIKYLKLKEQYQYQ